MAHRSVYALLALGILAQASPAVAQEVNTISKVTVAGDGQKSTIVVTGSRRPTFQAYTQKAPVRVVLDLVKSQLQNVPAAQPATPKDLTAGVLVTDVRTQQMGTAGRELARVEIVFADDIDYVVDADGTALKLTATRRVNPAVLAAEAAAREKAEKEKAELARLEKEKAEKAERERIEMARLEKENAEKAEALRIEREKAELARLEKEKADKAEKDRLELARAEKEKADKIAKEKAAELARLEKEKADKERAEKEKADLARAEKDKAEKAERDRADREKAELARADREKADRERADREKAEKAERAEMARGEREKAERSQREKAEAQKLADMKARVAREEQRAEPVAAAPKTSRSAGSAADAPSVQDAEEEERDDRTERAPMARQGSRMASPDGSRQEEEGGGGSSGGGAPRVMTFVGFKNAGDASQVVVRTNDKVSFNVRKVGQNKVAIELDNCRILLRNNQRPLDTSFFLRTAVRMITPEEKEGSSRSVRLVVDLSEDVQFDSKQEGNTITVSFQRPAG